jgi:putative transposase
MARLPRLAIAHQAHHIIQRGNDRQPIFRDADDRLAFLGWLKEAARQYQVAIHAYVLMDNHIHLLATPADSDGMSRMMQRIGRFYVPYFNQKYGRVGTLWQGRYKASVVEAERYLIACSRYIELNPVRAGIVADVAVYPWSSYPHHVGVRVDPLVTDHPLYWALGNTPFERELAYKQLLEQVPDAGEVDAMTQSVLKGWALGSEQFKSRLEKQVSRRVQPAKRGRPPKRVPAT